MGAKPVTFEPASATVWVEPGTTLLDAARKAGVGIEATCAGRGTCGACGVRVVDGTLSQPDPTELRVLGPEPGTVRLACRARVNGPVTVRPLLRTAITSGGSTEEAQLSSAVVVGVDLGTTTVVAAALDATTGFEVGRATTENDQRSFGADVLSRLAAAAGGEAVALRQAASRSIERAVLACVGQSGARVERVVVAANTAMATLLLGLPVDSLASAPFSAPKPWPLEFQPSAVDDTLLGAEWSVVAPMGAFVGGDVLAGVLATELLVGARPALLIDVGTNGEVALAAGDTLFVASGPAGPAFEGDGISCAGPVGVGGIVSVSLDEEGALVTRTVGDGDPRWFTGAGLVSATALLRRTGHLDESGLLAVEGPLESQISRSESGVLQVSFGDAVVLTQLDIRAIQLAVAAIRVTVRFVLEAAGIDGAALARVEVAGAFGAALDPADLVELGIVPADAADVVCLAHNTSLAGAVLLARMGASERHDAVATVLDAVRVIDMVGLSGFNDALMAAMRLERA